MALKRPLVSPKRKLSTPSVGKTLTRRPPKASSDFDGEKQGKVSEGGAFAAARAERKRQELERSKPFNVSVPVGGTLTVYLLDKGEPWKRYEHNIGGGPNSRGKTYPCIMDTNENCPLCTKEGKQGAFVMYLTAVVPVESYTKQGETEPVTRFFQKKLFPIKTKMSGKYERIFEKYGTFRGLVLKLSRDNKMDPATGNDVEVIRQMSEKEILALAANPTRKVRDRTVAITGEDKERIVKANIAVPFDYEKAMPTPKAKELAAMVGVKSGGAIGSADFEDDDDGGFGEADSWG